MFCALIAIVKFAVKGHPPDPFLKISINFLMCVPDTGINDKFASILLAARGLIVIKVVSKD